MPVDIVLRQLYRLPQNRFAQVRLLLLLVQLRDDAGCLKLHIIERIYILT